MNARITWNPRRARLTHAARVGLVLALMWLIPSPLKPVSDQSVAPQLSELPVGSGLANDLRIDPAQDANGMWRIKDEDGRVVSLVARTLPVAADVVGYRGPTEASIVVDPDLRIKAVGLLTSADTQEHVDAVLADKAFYRQFQGWPWGGPPKETEIDAVSGATLTSLALAEGVLKRIGGARPSLVFPQPLDINEIRDWFPEAASLHEASGEVQDTDGKTIGHVLRTGPVSDDVVGYQGPTELLLRMSPDRRVESIRIRESFDNEPYVDYVRTEAAFWTIFENKSLRQLAGFVPADAGVEGVSGATMTSLAVADTIVAAANVAADQATDDGSENPSWLSAIRWSLADLVTLVAIAATGLLSQLGWFHLRYVRRIWLLLVIIVIGLWSGNLISMALITGWSAEGVAWKLAPGLFVIAAVTLLMPPLAKRNPYCNHLCPHGAIQQLIRPGPRSRRHRKLPQSASRWLRRIPGVTLIVAYLALLIRPNIDLSSWEPFHAYLFQIAPWSATAFAGATLALSAVIPMGYCRFGCPTGRLIDHLRRTALSDRVGTGDWVAIGLLLVALTLRMTS